MKTLDYVFCVSGVLMLLLPAKGLCYSFQIGGECYVISTEKTGFYEAKEICENMNGKLVQLHDKEVFKIVTNVIATHREQYWVGLSKDEWDDIFSWDNAAEPKNNQWMPDEPNETGPCVRLCRTYRDQVFKKYRLADDKCTTKYNYICQKRQKFGGIAVSKGTQKDAYMNYYCPFMSYPLAGSRLKCAHACIMEPKCEGFVYNKTMSKCTMFTESKNCRENTFKVVVTAVERQCS